MSVGRLVHGQQDISEILSSLCLISTPSRLQIYKIIYFLHTCIVEMFAIYIAKKYYKYSLDMFSTCLTFFTEVHIDQGSLSLRHLSKCSWSTFPISLFYRDLYQSGDCLKRGWATFSIILELHRKQKFRLLTWS